MALSLDDMVAMMSILDADGDGVVSRQEFNVYYKRINKQCSAAAFDDVWRAIDADGDGRLTIDELCNFYGIDSSECARKCTAQKSLDDDKLLEALELQSLINEARQKKEMQKKLHAERLRKLAELAAEDEDEDVSSPTSTTAVIPPLMTMQELTRQAKRRGDLAAHHFANA